MGERLLIRVAKFIERWRGWDRVPLALGIPALAGIREQLREENLYDRGEPRPQPPPPEGDHKRFRTVDGTFNDLDLPLMGSVLGRFGRNVPLDATQPDPLPDLLEPNPRLISERLLRRDTFVPTGVNVLIPAWIQFEIHDWFSHGDNAEECWEIPVPDEDWQERPMRIAKTLPDPHPEPKIGDSPAYISYESHWWDGSQIYGNDARWMDAIRTHEGGKLRVENGLLPADLGRNLKLSGVAGNFWLGTLVLNTLFTLEHNAICDELARHQPSWSDEELFQTARLVNAALIAKIHTIEWTPALVGHPTSKLAMSINWWGLFSFVTKRWRRIGRSNLLFGIPGSKADHHGVPYSLTEEFTSVYRMHSLLPDEFSFKAAADGRHLGDYALSELGARHAPGLLNNPLGVADVFTTLGHAAAGAVTLHNYPRDLRHLVKPAEEPGQLQHIDLAATDILRDRERGVPRYNEFRRRFHLRPAKSFDDLTDNKEWARELSDVYGGDVERLDLMVGMLADRRPKGFAFSDTAFRVFILMASRRLQSDRFFTDSYNADVYTKAGLRWIRDTGLKQVLLRHYPELEPALRDVKNPFHVWAG